MRNNHSENIFVLISTALCFCVVFLISGCGGMGKMISVAAKLGKESDQLNNMNLNDVEALVSSDIDIDRLQVDPEGVVGQYVKLTGHADLEGSADFPMQVSQGPGKQDAMVFILEKTAFVITLENYRDIKQGDMVEVVGMVSSSRFLKAMKEMYPDQHYPDYVTVIAKTVKVIPPEPIVENTPEIAETPSEDIESLDQTSSNPDETVDT